MQNLEKRIAVLEGLRLNTNLSALTDEELNARIAAIGVKVDTPKELATCIAKLRAELSKELGQDHAKH